MPTAIRRFTAFFGGAATLAFAIAAPVQAAETIEPSAKAFAEMPACKALQETHKSLVGKELKVGLGGYTKGWEAPAEDDPSRLEGHDPSLFERIGGCLGMTPTYQTGSFNVLLTSINSGRADIGPMLYVTEERMKQVTFIASVQVRDGSIVAKGNPKKLTSLDSLCGMTVASAAGAYEATKLIPEQSKVCVDAGKPAIDLLLVQNTDNSIQAVRSGRADIYLTEAGSAGQITKTDDTLETAFTVDLPIMVGFPVAKEKGEIRDAVFAAMKIIQETGVQKKLLDFWGQGADGERPVEIRG
ncbi:transporter substrate-binding domain-containing protein [Aureimonas pseudogalii]|uniref:Polar amino acid transport system substrate-binding protein n=1 Tax=Aureimonas pseudogalii TaxID=1744844 RepID=A0A7W6H5R4_9HYPH|nr:transporter substrate-binding domain-containing protein [Aureimonas pseudogalii]MBB3999061.1 polar amino acid transport system substrate-binding protein [Aureimonas pseudogalii]